jgi:nucleotide-binding universal stress UspA family protein
MIVVGIDGSEGSEKALRFAAGEAALRKRGLRIVAAWHVPTSIYTHGFVVSPEIESELEASARAAAERQAANALQEHPEVISELLVCNQLPADALIQQSKEAEMLVVGSRGLGGFRGLMLGSVSQQCAQHARCPVVIVPHESTAG